MAAWPPLRMRSFISSKAATSGVKVTPTSSSAGRPAVKWSSRTHCRNGSQKTGPVVLDAETLLQHRALAVGRRRGDAVDHAVRERDLVANIGAEVPVDEIGKAGHRILRHVPVAGNVVAGHDGEGQRAARPAALERRDEDAEDAFRRVEMRRVVADLRMLGIEGAGRRIDAVAALGNRQRDDPEGRIVESRDDRARVLADRQETRHGSADARGVGAGLKLDDGGQPILRLEGAAHGRVAGPHDRRRGAPSRDSCRR